MTKKTKQIEIGGVKIGGGAPISVQSMCNTDTRDENQRLHRLNHSKKKVAN